MKTKKPLLFAAALMGAAASQMAFAPRAGAASIAVPNFSFETNPGGNPDTGSTSGWTQGNFVATANSSAPSGSFAGLLYEPGSTTMSVAPLLTIASNTIYSLSVYAMNVDNSSYAGFDGGLGDVILLANGTAIGGSASVLGFSSTDKFGLVTVSFNSASQPSLVGEALTVELGVNPNSTKDFSVEQFDDVTLTATATPEPSTIALLLGGMGALALVRCLRRTA